MINYYLFCLSLVFICLTTSVYSQTIIAIDPALTAATITANTAEKNKMRDIEKVKENINQAQIATTAVLTEIDKVQQKLYKGLTQVSAAVSNLYQIKYCYNAIQTILKYEGKMLQEAGKNPIALAFAYKNQKYLYERAIQAYTQITGFVLQNGDKAMMDAGTRTQLIYNILTELQALEAYAIASYYKVKRVVQVGIIQSLNPFQYYIDLDKRAIQDILNRVKF